VSALPTRQRAALVLRYYEGLDDAAIAEILGCSAVTVRTHVMRGLAALRTTLGPAGFPLASANHDWSRR
jgi:RNA polymerase sigma factor (sigma-70 family)